MKKYDKDSVEEFYSDSYSDKPMANLAKHAYIVKKNKVEVWKK